MNLDIVPSSRFRRDLKNAIRRGYDINLLKEAVDTLAAGKQLPPEKHDHPLRGEYAGCRECHIIPDWLLIYEINSTELVLYLTRTGSRVVFHPQEDGFRMVGEADPIDEIKGSIPCNGVRATMDDMDGAMDAELGRLWRRQ